MLLALLLLAVFFGPTLLVKRPIGLNELTGNQRVQAEISLAQARNSVRTTLVQALGGGIVLLTLIIGLGQLLVARQGQLVDRFTMTIEQLGSDKIDVRLGAIFALQQIAEQPEYGEPVAEILLAYLKTHATDQAQDSVVRGLQPRPPPVVLGADGDTGGTRLQPDLQAALRILVADGLWVRVMSGRKLDLSFIDVRYADLPGVDLSRVVLLGAILDGSNLRGARMKFSDLRRISLKDADLTGADLEGADLTGAVVMRAILDKAVLRDTLLVKADLRGANLKGADLAMADATGADLSSSTELNTELNGAKLDYADLGEAKFVNSVLFGASMQHVRLDSKTNLIHADMTKVVMDKETRVTLRTLFPQLHIDPSS